MSFANIQWVVFYRQCDRNGVSGESQIWIGFRRNIRPELFSMKTKTRIICIPTKYSTTTFGNANTNMASKAHNFGTNKAAFKIHNSGVQLEYSFSLKTKIIWILMRYLITTLQKSSQKCSVFFFYEDLSSFSDPLCLASPCLLFNLPPTPLQQSLHSLSCHPSPQLFLFLF